MTYSIYTPAESIPVLTPEQLDALKDQTALHLHNWVREAAKEKSLNVQRSAMLRMLESVIGTVAGEGAMSAAPVIERRGGRAARLRSKRG
jgi:hypothetical protein